MRKLVIGDDDGIAGPVVFLEEGDIRFVLFFTDIMVGQRLYQVRKLCTEYCVGSYFKYKRECMTGE